MNNERILLEAVALIAAFVVIVASQTVFGVF